jgi:regulator of replication initiation timing
MSKKTNPVTEMSVTCGFYNGADRQYDAMQMAKIFDGIIRDGIFASIGDCLVVKAGTGSTVNVGSGKAWFNHTWTLNDAILPVDCGEAEVLLNRIDAIVIEVDHTEAVRDNFIKVIHGTPATYPNNPELNTKSDVYQYPLCYIYRTAGVNEIVTANITNCVGTSEAPFITGILDVISIDELLPRWQAELDDFMASEKDDINKFMTNQEGEFDEWFRQMKTLMSNIINETSEWTEAQKNTILSWFDEMKDQLSVDAAINLQLQVHNEEIKRILAIGFIDGEKTFSEDGSVITTVDPNGNRLVKTFTNNFSICTTELFNSEGNSIARMVKTFSEDGSTINTETNITNVSLLNGDDVAY